MCTVDGCSEPHKAFGKCKRHYLQDYYAANRERDRELRRAHYLANADEYKLRAKINGATSRATNPQKERERSRRKYAAKSVYDRSLVWRRRRARELAADWRAISEGEWSRLVERYRHRCAYCDSSTDLTQDHIIPLSRGGRHSIGNVLPGVPSMQSIEGEQVPRRVAAIPPAYCPLHVRKVYDHAIAFC